MCCSSEKPGSVQGFQTLPRQKIRKYSSSIFPDITCSETKSTRVVSSCVGAVISVEKITNCKYRRRSSVYHFEEDKTRDVVLSTLCFVPCLKDIGSFIQQIGVKCSLQKLRSGACWRRYHLLRIYTTRSGPQRLTFNNSRVIVGCTISILLVSCFARDSLLDTVAYFMPFASRSACLGHLVVRVPSPHPPITSSPDSDHGVSWWPN